jgi:hypothetical protein
MNITELFAKIENHFESEEINGEYTLQGNCIVWECNLDNKPEEITLPSEDEDEDEIQYDFDSQSTEEYLQEKYNEDLGLLEIYLDSLDEYDNWNFSEPEVMDNIISFKIF